MNVQVLPWPRLVRLFSAVLLFGAVMLCLWPEESRGADVFNNLEQRRREVAALMETSTVCVLAPTEDGLSFGSGFIVAEGFIMTNAHVTSEADDNGIFVLNENLPLTRAEHVRSAYDSGNLERLRRRDFALLRFTPPRGKSLPALTFNLDVRRMDRVSAWGYPGMITMRDERMQKLLSGDLKNSPPPPPVVYTEGTVNALVKSGGEAVIHSAAISSGNSGGPLVNSHGEVVGINTWVYKEDDEGAFINAALPAHLIVDFLRANGIAPKLSDRQRPKAGEPLAALGPETENAPDAPQPGTKAEPDADAGPGAKDAPGRSSAPNPDEKPAPPSPPARSKLPFNTQTPDGKTPPPDRDERAPKTKLFGTN